MRRGLFLCVFVVFAVLSWAMPGSALPPPPPIDRCASQGVESPVQPNPDDPIIIILFYCFPNLAEGGEQPRAFVFTDFAEHNAPCVGAKLSNNGAVTLCVLGAGDFGPLPDSGQLPTAGTCGTQTIFINTGLPGIFISACAPAIVRGEDNALFFLHDNEGNPDQCLGFRTNSGAHLWVCLLQF